MSGNVHGNEESGADASLQALYELAARSDCVVASSGSETIVDGVTQARDVELRCPGDASDPRLVGEARVVVSVDQFADESAAIWGTATITTPDGSWDGSWTGTVAAGYTTHRMTGVFIGSGAYAGLEFRYTQIGEDPYVMTGTIGPAQ